MRTIPLLSLLLGALCGLSQAAATKPNIVLILIDDMGYADIGPFGNKELRTPHLDKFAAEGMKFTSFYATPVCSSSRASLMTGCYHPRVSIPGVLFPRDTIGLNPAEVTLAEIVKQKGYATCAIGKWHLGHEPEFMPLRQGFDRYFGLPYSNDMIAGRNTMPPLPLYDDEKVIETEPDQSQLTRRYTEQAVEFIRQHKDGPFFVYLPHTMIHFPLAASEAFKGKSKLGLVGDTIEEIDWSVGEILTTLNQLGLDEKTLVIFTSDNGPAKRPAPPFRGNKGTHFEGGVRVPCMMRWPGKIPAGTTSNQIAGVIDILPTISKLVDVEPARNLILDGRDITPLMFNAGAGPVRDTHLYYGGNQAVAIRQGNWKLFLKGTDLEMKAEITAKTKGKPKKGGPVPRLYNLATDSSESQDVAAANPKIVAHLQQELLTRDAGIQANKRPCGKHAKP